MFRITGYTFVRSLKHKINNASYANYLNNETNIFTRKFGSINKSTEYNKSNNKKEKQIRLKLSYFKILMACTVGVCIYKYIKFIRLPHKNISVTNKLAPISEFLSKKYTVEEFKKLFGQGPFFVCEEYLGEKNMVCVNDAYQQVHQTPNPEKYFVILIQLNHCFIQD